MISWKPKPNPHDPADYGDDGLVPWAIRALYAGEATSAQQKLAWEWIMYVTGAGDGYQDLSYRPKDPDATNFAEGKRFVGLQIRKMLRPEVTPKTVKK